MIVVGVILYLLVALFTLGLGAIELQKTIEKCTTKRAALGWTLFFIGLSLVWPLTWAFSIGLSVTKAIDAKNETSSTP